MNRYGKPLNDNYVYMVNVCDDVVLFKHTQAPNEENKVCEENGTSDMRKENLRNPITHPTRT
jgi:hypothetical protein